MARAFPFPGLSLLFAALLAAGTSTLTAHAQSGELGVGMLAAKSDTPVARASAIAVEFGDDTGLNVRLKKHIEAALRSKGYTVAERADTRLVFDSEINAEASITSGLVPPVGTFKRNRAEGLRLVIPGLAEGRQVKGTTYYLHFSVQRSGVPPLWTGSAFAVARKADWFKVTGTMATHLVDAIGKTVKGRQFALDR